MFTKKSDENEKNHKANESYNYNSFISEIQ